MPRKKRSSSGRARRVPRDIYKQQGKQQHRREAYKQALLRASKTLPKKVQRGLNLEVPSRIVVTRAVAPVRKIPTSLGDSIRDIRNCPVRRLVRRKAMFASGSAGKYHAKTNKPRKC